MRRHHTTGAGALLASLRSRIPRFEGRARIGWLIVALGAVQWVVYWTWKLIGFLGDLDFLHSRVIPAVQPVLDATLRALSAAWDWPGTGPTVMVVGFIMLLVTRPPAREIAPQKDEKEAPEMVHDNVLWIGDRGTVAGPFCPGHRSRLLYTRQYDQQQPSDVRVANTEQDVVGSGYGALYCPPCGKLYLLRADANKRLKASSLEVAAHFSAMLKGTTAQKVPGLPK